MSFRCGLATIAKGCISPLTSHRALAAGEAITVAMDPATHTLSGLVPSGVLIASPFRTSQTEGAVLVYPRREGPFSGEEKSLVSAITSFGAVAMANAELYATARAQAHELHQILSISSELGSIGQLDQFMQQFVLRGSDFLGFGRAFVGLWKMARFTFDGNTARVKAPAPIRSFPESVASRALAEQRSVLDGPSLRSPRRDRGNGCEI